MGTVSASGFSRAILIRQVLPGAQLVQLEVTHPIFDSFFHIETLDFEHPNFPEVKPVYYGIFEDNDPSKRLMVRLVPDHSDPGHS